MLRRAKKDWLKLCYKNKDNHKCKLIKYNNFVLFRLIQNYYSQNILYFRYPTLPYPTSYIEQECVFSIRERFRHGNSQTAM